MSEHKAFTGWEVKDADQGLVQAVFSTFSVIDHDGDVTEPGAFEDGAPVRISAYGHASWGSSLPVGKGVIRATGTEAVLDGRFFLETQAGKDTFATVKGMGELQEWSYGFDVVESGDGKQDDRQVRFLRKLKVHEVSPVMLGAGVDTRTLAVKATEAIRDAIVKVSPPAPPESTLFDDDAEHALGSVQALITRAQALGSLRAEKQGKTGRVLSAANRDRLAALLAAMGDAHIALDELLSETDPDKHRNAQREAVIREYALYQRSLANL